MQVITNQKSKITNFDFLLFTSALLLAIFGASGIYAATLSGDGDSYFGRQLIWVGAGILACLLVASINYHFLIDHAVLLYVLSILMLIAALLFGVEVHGTRSWLDIGVRVQTSEISKIGLILILAGYLSGTAESRLTRGQFLSMCLLTALPVVLIILQGDLGTALVFLPILFGIAVVAGLSSRILIWIIILAVLLAPLGWFFLEDYQKERVLVTLDVERDPQGVGYQTRQSKIAIGSGGFLGKGLGNGLQSQLGFVPEVHTDFIFSLLTEELGFLGASLILLLYLLMLMRLLRIAQGSQDRAGILIVTGVASLICFHVAINVGMALGILPSIGIPLPLISYGGSATVTTFVAIGLALSVYYRRFLLT